ncbi:MAG TPA: RIP metalloprotease RseP [Ignavibacteriales bacterium]|nr:RIP metalloprotease RseP [Ignavibacteriales bacterium]
MISYLFYFIITIGVLVFIHEFGHFIAAKWMKMRVEVFSLGFGYRLVGWNKVKGLTFGNMKDDEDLGDNTDYRLSLIPLGGYVKISGMIDESLDQKNLSSEPQPWEYRSKKPLAKIFVISAGVLMNLLLAYFIFFYNNAFIGKVVINTTQIGRIPETSAAYGTGLQENDVILEINNQKVNNWEEVIKNIFVNTQGKDVTFLVKRDEKVEKITVKREKIPSDPSQKLFLVPAKTKAFIADVMKGGSAQKSGLQAGDILLSINDTLVLNSQQAVSMIKNKINKKIDIKVLRNKDTLLFQPMTNEDGKIGIAINEIYDGPVTQYKYSIGEAAIKSFANIYEYTALTFTMLGKVFKGDIKFQNAFGGPIKIAQFATKSAEGGIVSFLSFLALLSLSLAIINILPIPGLDGGHIVIEIIEAVIRRELPVKAKLFIQQIGMGILLLLMVVVIYYDVISTFFKK